MSSDDRDSIPDMERSNCGLNAEQKLPNFLCIGAQKAGTTLLHEILKQHPQVFLPPIKEVHFFDNFFDKGIEFYRSFFAGSDGYRLIGEITPSYIYLDRIPERILAILGSNMKFLVMLRNPADRAYSHYWMSFRRGHEKLSFLDAISAEPLRLEQGNFARSHFSYVSRGFYATQISRYYNYFPETNFKIVIFEEFIQDICGHMAEIMDFLGCDAADIGINPNEKVHAGDMDFRQYMKAILHNGFFFPVCGFSGIGTLLKEGKIKCPKLDSRTRHLLMNIFHDDISNLELFLGRDLAIWRTHAQ